MTIPRPVPVSGARRVIADLSTFLGESVRTFTATGAVAPSGPQLGLALTRFLRERPAGPMAVMEAGAGTGAVTRHIAAALRSGDTLDVVEVNKTFADRLRQGFGGVDPVLARHIGKVGLHEIQVQDLAAHNAYDLIVSCLPFMNFSPEDVSEILASYWQALRPGGRLSFFSYLGTGPLQAIISGPGASARRQVVQQTLTEAVNRYGVGSEVIMTNLPPARVYHLQVP